MTDYPLNQQVGDFTGAVPFTTCDVCCLPDDDSTSTATIQTTCCEPPISATLYMTITDKTVDCATCIPDDAYTLTYDVDGGGAGLGSGWVSDAIHFPCRPDGFIDRWLLICSGSTWTLRNTFAWEADAATCDPFTLTFNATAGTGGMNVCGTGGGTFIATITE